MADLGYWRTGETLEQFRKRVLKIQSMVNKRLKRIEEAGLTEESVYSALRDRLGADGQIRFSVKGKNAAQLTAQYWQMMNFINAKTSTVKGIRQQMKETAKAIGYKFAKNGFTANAQLADFFKISRVLEDYYTAINNRARAMDYRRMFYAINRAIQIDRQEIGNLKQDGEKLKKLLDTTLNELGESYAQDTLDQLANEFRRR